MEVDGLDGEEIEGDELHIASLEADAGEDFGGEDVGDPEFEEEFHDNRSGEYLDPELVAKARSEEVKFMAKIGLYQEVDIAECLEITGRPPISTRWVDVNKGSMESPNVRCRPVARDFKPKGERSIGHLRRNAAAGGEEAPIPKGGRREKGVAERRMVPAEDHRKPTFMASSRITSRHSCCRLTGSASKGSVGGSDVGCTACGQPRALGRNTTRRTLVDMGFAKGVTAATVFYDKARDNRCMVHGDDFTLLGWEEDLHDVRDGLKAKYEFKVRGSLVERGETSAR